jgi:hypothetical protein
MPVWLLERVTAEPCIRIAPYFMIHRACLVKWDLSMLIIALTDLSQKATNIQNPAS